MLETVVFDTESRFLIERATGRLTFEDVRDGLRARLVDPGFRDVDFIVTDERDVEEYDLTAGEIREVALLLLDHVDVFRAKRWGVIVDAPKSAALSLLLQEILDDSFAFRVFTSVPGLVAWIGGPPELAKNLDPFI